MNAITPQDLEDAMFPPQEDEDDIETVAVSGHYPDIELQLDGGLVHVRLVRAGVQLAGTLMDANEVETLIGELRAVKARMDNNTE
jgi:hypothetical protein